MAIYVKKATFVFETLVDLLVLRFFDQSACYMLAIKSSQRDLINRTVRSSSKHLHCGVEQR